VAASRVAFLGLVVRSVCRAATPRVFPFFDMRWRKRSVARPTARRVLFKLVTRSLTWRGGTKRVQCFDALAVHASTVTVGDPLLDLHSPCILVPLNDRCFILLADALPAS
jgi:hypothetical protein